MTITAINSLADLNTLLRAGLSGDYKQMCNIDASPTNPANVADFVAGVPYNTGDYAKGVDGNVYSFIGLDGECTPEEESYWPGNESNVGPYWGSNPDFTSAGFYPIGTSLSKFTGSFDGNGYTISNLFINRPAEAKRSLFGYGNGCSISNVGIVDCDITGGNESCPLISSATGTYSISNCYATGTVTSSGNYATGMFGSLTGTGDATDVYTLCSVTGPYASGVVSYLGANNTIRRAYAAGAITGDNAKGFTAINVAGTTQDCYWDTEATGQATSAPGATGLTTAEMQQLWNKPEFDFINDWFQPVGGYPELRAFHGRWKRRKKAS